MHCAKGLVGVRLHLETVRRRCHAEGRIDLLVLRVESLRDVLLLAVVWGRGYRNADTFFIMTYLTGNPSRIMLKPICGHNEPL